MRRNNKENKDYYGFIPFYNHVERKDFRPVAHQAFQPDLYHGRFTFQLAVLSPLLVHAQVDENGKEKQIGQMVKGANGKKHYISKSFLRSKHPRHKGQPVIPGSSLKGMVRSVFEIITPSCHFGIRESSGKCPAKQPCNSIETLCPTCSLFGAMEQKPNSNKPYTWKGRLRISDALPVSNQSIRLARNKVLPILMNPRPKKRPGSTKYHDYFPNGQMAGRKRYLASAPFSKATLNRDKLGQPGPKPLPAEALVAPSLLSFSMDFWNLNRAERGVLLRSLLLEPGQVHLLGTAKAHGWGKCRLILKQWQQWQPHKRYNGGNGIQTIAEKDWGQLIAHDLKFAAGGNSDNKTTPFYLKNQADLLAEFHQPRITQTPSK